MADTGFKLPTSNGETFADFDNPTNAYTDDEDYATANTYDGDAHDYYNFSFNVPEDVEIEGIEVEIKGKPNATSASQDLYISLSHNGGTNYTSTKWDWIRNGDYTYTFGNSSEEWGRTWSDAEFSNANFRVKIATADDGYPGTNLFYMYYVKIKVYYAEAAPTPTYTSVNIGDDWKTISGANVVKVNIGDDWKNVSAMKVNIGDAWKAVTIS